MSILSELKRRNVFRVALLYLVASWLIFQVTDVGVSLLGLPDWTGRLVFLLLLIGFPPVLVFSWVYEITPEGVKREKDIDRDQSITDATARKLNTAVIVLLVMAVAGLIADRLVPETTVTPAGPAPAASETVQQSAASSENSIAVLPFVNMSSDPENEYFSDGLSEELLNLLAKIPELRVAARTSAFSFKGSNADIAEISSTLNVAHVLEGSVRKSGDNIRITAQLIKASDGYHLWSETWDRRLVDVFDIQDEIAAAVVSALRVTLLGELPKAHTTDPKAYELYLQSWAATDLGTPEGFQRAIGLLTGALAIDPNFADGWSRLSSIQINQAGAGFVDFADGYRQARASAERALALDPDNAKAMANIGWVAMYNDWDFETAVTHISEARRLEPGNASVLNALGVMYGNLGRVDDAIGLYEEALARDPVSMSVLANLTGAYLNKRRPDQAEELVARMRKVAPDSATTTVYAGWIQLFGGNAEAALDIFSGVEGAFGAWGRAPALYDLGRDAESDAAIAELVSEGGDVVQVAMCYAYRGEAEKAFEWLERGYAEHDDGMIELHWFSWFEPLYGDPRWNALLTRIGISEADANRYGI